MAIPWGRLTFTLTCGAALAVVAACSSEPLGPTSRTAPTDANVITDYTSETGEECPYNVPESDCVPITQTERDQLYWDILLGVHWDNEECAQVGNRALAMIQNGDIRKYPMMTSYYLGFWRPARELGAERIAFRSDMLVTYGDRMETMVHESSHSRWNRGDHGFALYDPYWAEANCIDW